MPLYEYECPDHGRFEEFASATLAHQDGSCPHCATASRRVMSVPRMAVLSPAQRQSHQRNEKSRHQPGVHTCSSGCSHGPGAAKAAGLQSYQGPRPWVIEHG